MPRDTMKSWQLAGFLSLTCLIVMFVALVD